MASQPQQQSAVKPIIGVDFDNTIINYDNLMYSWALEKGFINSKVKKNKKDIRDAVRKNGGDLQWQKLQSEAYGKEIARATLNSGVKEFLIACKKQQIPIYIISHKTKHSNLIKDKVNLRQAALRWIQERGFFNHKSIGLRKETIYFESSREDKINRIKKNQCTYFIDDLEEIFLDSGFPKSVKKILYVSSKTAAKNHLLKDVTITSSWREIRDYFIKERVLKGRIRNE